MDEKQVNLIHWLYNFAIVEMASQPDKFLESDQFKLREAIERRFPEYVDEITKPFDLSEF